MRRRAASLTAFSPRRLPSLPFPSLLKIANIPSVRGHAIDSECSDVGRTGASIDRDHSDRCSTAHRSAWSAHRGVPGHHPSRRNLVRGDAARSVRGREANHARRPPLARAFVEHCGDIPLNKLTCAMASDFLTKVSQQGKANRTTNNYAITMNSLFKSATNRGRFTGNTRPPRRVIPQEARGARPEA
jgi:hypothetical protein